MARFITGKICAEALCKVSSKSKIQTRLIALFSDAEFLYQGSFQLQFDDETRRQRATDEDSVDGAAMQKRGSQRSFIDEIEVGITLL